MSDGVCFLCGKTFSKIGMTKHLKSCIRKNIKEKKVKVFHLLIDGLEYPEYWIHIEIKGSTPLATLDEFLKDLWLECCDHLSGFWFQRPFSDQEISKLAPAENVFEPGLQIYYVYDFGTSTILRIKVISEYMSNFKGKLRLIARNRPIKIHCKCGKEAKYVCTECLWSNPEEAWLCDECAKQHACGMDMLLDVVDSPRVGECAYTGSSLTDIFELYEYY